MDGSRTRSDVHSRRFYASRELRRLPMPRYFETLRVSCEICASAGSPAGALAQSPDGCQSAETREVRERRGRVVEGATPWRVRNTQASTRSRLAMLAICQRAVFFSASLLCAV